MKNIAIILLFITYPLVSLAQHNASLLAEFNSVFQDLTEGQFEGTVSGMLVLKESNQKEFILDFQASESELLIEKDKHEIYDVSTKIYTGKTTSGQTKIQYKTYAYANCIGVELNGQWFEKSLIDGSCEGSIDGLSFNYQQEPAVEYLVLIVEKEVKISNWRYILKTERTKEPDNIEKLECKRKEYTILPKSVLLFAIKR